MNLLEKLAARLVAWSERYLPDAFVFALVATVLVVLFAIASSGKTASVFTLADAWGKGFFSLLPFTLQMAMIIISGHVVASAPQVTRLIDRVAGLPTTGRGAVAMVTLLALLSSWLNWGFSLIFSAMLARRVAKRFAEQGIRVDYRALSAASFLGLGSIWAQGLSGSAALQVASVGSMPESIAKIIAGPGGIIPSGIIPLSSTIFLWQSLLAVGLEIVVVTLIMWRACPAPERTVTAEDLAIPTNDDHDLPQEQLQQPGHRPGDYLEHTGVLPAFILVIGVAYLYRYFAVAPRPLDALNLNTVNLIFLLLGVLLHRTPFRLMRAFAAATPSIWGVLLQFPFYGGIAAMIAATALNERLANAFVAVSTRETFPPIIAVYSAVLGIFVPSGGGKWLIEAPYVMGAAHSLKVHLGWMVAVYDLGEALANLVQPFWMLPVLALLRLKARDVMGYTILVFLILLPLVLLMTYFLGKTLGYPL